MPNTSQYLLGGHLAYDFNWRFDLWCIRHSALVYNLHFSLIYCIFCISFFLKMLCCSSLVSPWTVTCLEVQISNKCFHIIATIFRPHVSAIMFILFSLLFMLLPVLFFDWWKLMNPPTFLTFWQIKSGPTQFHSVRLLKTGASWICLGLDKCPLLCCRTVIEGILCDNRFRHLRRCIFWFHVIVSCLVAGICIWVDGLYRICILRHILDIHRRLHRISC